MRFRIPLCFLILTTKFATIIYTLYLTTLSDAEVVFRCLCGLRKEHAGNDPTTQLVPAGGSVGGWKTDDIQPTKGVHVAVPGSSTPQPGPAKPGDRPLVAGALAPLSITHNLIQRVNMLLPGRTICLAYRIVQP